MIARFFIFAALGKLLMLLLRKFPPAVRVAEKIHFPIDCDLCLGFWVYTVTALFFPIWVIDGYIPVVSEVIQGAVTTWTTWVFTAGWHSTYSIYEVNTDASG